MWFWKINNPRIGKLLNAGEFPFAGEESSFVVELPSGFPTGETTSALDEALRQNQMGHALTTDAAEVMCVCPGEFYNQAPMLATIVLRRMNVPEATVLRRPGSFGTWRQAVYPRREDLGHKEAFCNLRQLKRSRKAPAEGDVICFSVNPAEYFFGWVVRAGLGPSGSAVLSYFYQPRSDSPDKVPEFDKDSMLLPPLVVDDSAWRKGFVQRCGNRVVSSSDMLERHCFFDPAVTDRCIDEFGADAHECDPKECAPVGPLHYLALAGRLTAALGIPAPPAVP